MHRDEKQTDTHGPAGYDWSRALTRRGGQAGKWHEIDRDIAAGRLDPALDVYPFSVADNDMAPAPVIRDALVDFARDGVLGYPLIPDAWYHALAQWLALRHDWSIERSWVLTSSGVVSALYASVATFTEPGDGVIVMQPVYPPFMSAVTQQGRRLINCPLQRRGLDYRLDFEALEAAAREPETKMLLLCSPHNPVGRVWTPEELGQLATICARHGILVVSDEIHLDLVRPDLRHTVYARVSEEAAAHAIIALAPSKSFNIAGCYMSAVLIPNDELRRRYQTAVAHSGVAGPNAFGLVAAEAAWRAGGPWLDGFNALIADNHRALGAFCAEQLPEVGVVPLEGSYLQWLETAPLAASLGLDEDGFMRFLREEALFYITPGQIFGSEGAGFIRVNIGCPRGILMTALERLAEAVRRRRADGSQR